MKFLINTDGSAWIDLVAVPAGETSGTLYVGKPWILDGVVQPGVYEWNPVGTDFLFQYQVKIGGTWRLVW